jgi:alpha-2-macroglobulin
MKELFSVTNWLQVLRSKAVLSLQTAARFASSAFGSFSWEPPGWLSRIRTVSSNFINLHPRLSLAGILVAFSIAAGAGATLHWYEHRPKPHKVYATVEPIPVTGIDKLNKKLEIPALVIHFSESAARLEDLGNAGAFSCVRVLPGPSPSATPKPSLSNVRLDPQVDGKWCWINDRTLMFRPREDWPADQKYRVIFDKKFFPRHVLMDRLVYEAHTPAFAINLKELKLYQDPFDPAHRQVTATFELTHSIDPGELEKKVCLIMVGESSVFTPDDPAPHFAITYGLFRRTAYLRSSAVKLPEREDFLKLVLSKGVRTVQGGAQTQSGLEQKIRIPSVATMFQISAVEGMIAPDKNGEPEQLLMIQTTADINTRELAKAIEVRFLPERKPSPQVEKNKEGEDEESDEAEVDGDEDSLRNDVESDDFDEETGTQRWAARHYYYPRSERKDEKRWKSPADVPEQVFAQAKPVEFTPVPSDKAQDQQHVLRIRVESNGELYVRIRKGVRAAGDYPLTQDHNTVLPVPELPREVQIQGEGGLLALNGERKLSIRTRGLAAVEYEIARVATTQINHLISQTEGQFQHPQFQVPYLFNRENISRIALEHQSIAMENRWKSNYSSFDFSKYLQKPDDGGSERGLFFLTARGWDPVKQKVIPSVGNNRFLLVTDIGILTKKGAGGGHDVFLMSIETGKPIAGAEVEILGKNGIALQTTKTDADGHCAFPSFEKATREKTPCAFLARLGDDVSFIPYSRTDRILNFSRFDTGGDENVLPENLNAFVFTERGVYRPGDEIHIGVVIKQQSWQQNISGLPFETEILDARGLEVQTKKLTLPEGGFTELSYQTANESATGGYSINVYLIKNNKRATLLGSTTVQVKEFLPDRMKIETVFSQPIPRGWVKPKDLQAKITLANLYGTPGTDRKITGHLSLSPSGFSFSEFPDYCFYDPLFDEKEQREYQAIDLGEQHTDSEGHAEFDLQLERFADATYEMQVVTQGFEGEGGRSVTSEIGARVSALPYVIGSKPDGGLNYIQLNKPRALNLIAVDPQLNRIAVENLTVNIIAEEYVSVLTKQENGNYAYESVLKERTAKSEKIAVAAGGLRYALPTAEPGNYVFELRDDQNRRVSKASFCVVGRGLASRSLEKNAELEIKLERDQFNSGDDISISIRAAFSGAGLITIERDRVYAYQWFEAKTTSSVQHIRVPESFAGSGYINVTFVRALDSKEIFASPLSYGAIPFTANKEKRRLKIDIQTPAVSKPGEPLHIRYQTDRPGKIVLFAVDEGILQVTNYRTPDPLGFFFRKCALGVRTAQIVDLIIPEFSVLRSISAFGGDGSDQRLNRFKRVTEKPVVFWSGIVETDTSPREVVYNVPDFFDGNLKVMAVAVANEAIGSVERNSLIRGPFVITPSVPVLAAPGDEFEAGVTVANTLEGSGPTAEIELRAETNALLSILQAPVQKLRIAEGREQSATFRFRVNEKLGSGEIRFTASRNGTEIKRRATLSVRPPVPYMTEVHSGRLNKGMAEIPVRRAIHLEFRKLNAAISAVPLGLAHGLDAYLKDFPHGCSEQVTSGAFCRLLLSDEADFGLSRVEINAQLEKTFSILRRRQNDQGAFGYWAPENDAGISFVSVYVMDFLTEAKSAGFAPPSEMFTDGLRNLQKMVTHEPASLSDARTIAYAIYVLTREDVITTNYILNLRDYLEKKQRDNWQNDITGVYLAGALHRLHKDAEAEKLIGQYKLDSNATRSCDDFYQPLGTDSQYIAVLAREFPSRLKRISAEEFERILQPIGDGEFNTLSAAYAVRALKSYSHVIAQNLPELSIAEIRANKQEIPLTSGAKLLQRTNFSGEATALRFQTGGRLGGPGVFFQVVEAGFDRQLPREQVTNGLEVYRELLDGNDNQVTRTRLGEAIRVRLHVRSLLHKPITNAAIIDLLPGGFEVVDTSVHAGVCSKPGVDYIDLREDRAVFFTTATVGAIEIDYKIKSCNRGEFVVPPVFAQSMYDRNVKGRGLGGRITVTE